MAYHFQTWWAEKVSHLEAKKIKKQRGMRNFILLIKSFLRDSLTRYHLLKALRSLSNAKNKHGFCDPQLDFEGSVLTGHRNPNLFGVKGLDGLALLTPVLQTSLMDLKNDSYPKNIIGKIYAIESSQRKYQRYFVNQS